MVASTDRSTLRVRTTSASPTAATAMIEAWTATWLRFDDVRNCGAAIETMPLSTNMIARRLSSRWRATAESQVPRPRAGLGIVRTGSGTDDCLPGRAGRRINVGAARGGEHHPFGAGLSARNLGGEPALVQDHDPIGHGQDLGQVARDQDDPEARG